MLTFKLLGMICVYILGIGFCLAIVLYFIVGALHSQDNTVETNRTKKFIVYGKKEDE